MKSPRARSALGRHLFLFVAACIASLPSYHTIRDPQSIPRGFLIGYGTQDGILTAPPTELQRIHRTSSMGGGNTSVIAQATAEFTYQSQTYTTKGVGINATNEIDLTTFQGLSAAYKDNRAVRVAYKLDDPSNSHVRLDSDLPTAFGRLIVVLLGIAMWILLFVSVWYDIRHRSKT